MRAELDRLLRANPLWDERVGVLQVTDAVDGYVRVRMLVSAPNAPALFDLRCDVREGMVQWLQRAHPGALPRRRLAFDDDHVFESSSSTTHVGRPGRIRACSPEAPKPSSAAARSMTATRVSAGPRQGVRARQVGRRIVPATAVALRRCGVSPTQSRGTHRLLEWERPDVVGWLDGCNADTGASASSSVDLQVHRRTKGATWPR